jgi:hypothetical protein
VAASGGFIPSDDAIDELFQNCGASFRTGSLKLQMKAMLA